MPFQQPLDGNPISLLPGGASNASARPAQTDGAPCKQEGGEALRFSHSRVAGAQPRGLPKAARASRRSPPQCEGRMAADADPPPAQRENSPPGRENGRPEKERGGAKDAGICCRRRIQGAPEVRHLPRPIYAAQLPISVSSRFASHQDGA